MEQTSREALSHNKAAKDHTRETTLTTKQSQITHESDTRHSLYPDMDMRRSCGYMR